MALALLLFVGLFQLSFGDVEECFECDFNEIGICCGDPEGGGGYYPDTDTTEAPGTTDGDYFGTTDDADTGYTCNHWISNRFSTFSAAGGAPLDVCFGAFSGVELTSVSYIYTCSEDLSTVEYWSFTGSSDCNADTATIVNQLPFAFDPINYPLGDTFECSADESCPYYLIEDGTAHPTQTCPFDVGKDYVTGGEDYATWTTNPLLQGCQSWDDETSLLAKCSSTGGITLFSFSNSECDADGLIGGEEIFTGGTIECNYGTGRAVYCFDDDDDLTTTGSPTTTDDDDDTDPSSTDTDPTVGNGNPTTTEMDTNSTKSTESSTVNYPSSACQYKSIFYVFIILGYLLV
eukprot:493889_1